MKLQLQPNRWSCFPTSLAMVLERPVAEILTVIGHDGSEVLWPDLPEPQKRRTFSCQEIVMAADFFGVGLVQFDSKFYTCPDDEHIYEFDPPKGFMPDKLRRYSGILTGTTLSGKRHAVAWDKSLIFDPSGMSIRLSDFFIENFWAAVNVNS